MAEQTPISWLILTSEWLNLPASAVRRSWELVSADRTPTGQARIFYLRALETERDSKRAVMRLFSHPAWTPAFFIELIETLVETNACKRREIRRAEDKLLSLTQRNGQWVA